ncbi:DNA-binding transcriptional regulator, FadR family [Actinomadura meyerae]|jgi:DNA-binding FadR family transcriptional regulator|uniref:DNA-binding transcriptional regulator, FadR family n=1 Tax=Actinomadura meyerae TaxID=240840 RepID=A0A239NC97_9ACTN|nr:FadR/GntR family transcriptional regulator [Actinomadura meyerae]SNT51799.1 DNA-binding transcriptional regulator, FadR family [Actinomadura meyerae]
MLIAPPRDEGIRMAPLGRLRPSPLVEQAAQRLREQIADGSWPVGTRLPGETTLARELGVGRSTVREALRALAGAGLVQARQGAGVFVIATEPDEDWPARLRRASVADVYEIRMMLEVRAAELAAERRTDADLDALRAALGARDAAFAGPSTEGFIDADIALHTAVVAAAHNPVLADLFAEFVPVLRDGLLDLATLVDVRASDTAHGRAAHAALVDAVAAGDPEAAGRIIRAELTRTLRALLQGR